MDEYKKMEDMEIPPNRYLVVVADAVGWDDRKKIHEYGYKNEQIEGIYSIYEEAVKVFEKISRKRKPDKTIDNFVEMRDKLTTHTYRISEKTIRYMLWEKMNFDQMKEYLLKYRESWLKVEHDVSPSEEVADFFSSKAFTEE